MYNLFFVLLFGKLFGHFRSTTISSFRAIFPYEHNFADAIRKEMVSIVKWIKMIHHRQKGAFTAASPLPADMIVKVVRSPLLLCIKL